MARLKIIVAVFFLHNTGIRGLFIYIYIYNIYILPSVRLREKGTAKNKHWLRLLTIESQLSESLDLFIHAHMLSTTYNVYPVSILLQPTGPGLTSYGIIEPISYRTVAGAKCPGSRLNYLKERNNHTFSTSKFPYPSYWANAYKISQCATEEKGRAIMEGEHRYMSDNYSYMADFAPKPIGWGDFKQALPETYFHLMDAVRSTWKLMIFIALIFYSLHRLSSAIHHS